jgi:hypothetical protein
MGLKFERKTGGMGPAAAIDACAPQSAGAMPITSRKSLVPWLLVGAGFPRDSIRATKIRSLDLTEQHCRRRMALKHLERLSGEVGPAVTELLC